MWCDLRPRFTVRSRLTIMYSFPVSDIKRTLDALSWVHVRQSFLWHTLALMAQPPTVDQHIPLARR